MKKIILVIVALSSVSAFAQISKGGSEVSPNSRNRSNSHVLITGKSAKALFEKLKVPVGNDSHGPFQYFRKNGSQIACTLEKMSPQTVPATPDTYSCALLVAPNGDVLSIDEL